jgi:LysM repeat protein
MTPTERRVVAATFVVMLGAFVLFGIVWMAARLPATTAPESSDAQTPLPTQVASEPVAVLTTDPAAAYVIAAPTQSAEPMATETLAMSVETDTPDALSTTATAPPTTRPATYVVQLGDTLFTIALRFGTTVEALKAVNGLQSDAIFAGQTLLMPPGADGGAPAAPSGATASPASLSPVQYVVKAGDTLFTLALRFNTSVTAIKTANNLTGDTIFVGQTLTIPQGGGLIPTSTLAASATRRPATQVPASPTLAAVALSPSPWATVVTATPSATAAPAATATIAFSGVGALPIPGPSPTWSVYSFPTRAPASGPTKLGFHVTLNSGGVLDYVAAVKPPVMKGVDDIGFLKDVKALSPGTITIGRFVVDQPNIGSGDAAQRAIDFVNEQLPRYLQHKDYVDYWEGWNEVTYPNYEWYAVFEATRACEMQKHGLKAAIGAFSTGTPEPWQFMAFLPAMEAGKRCGAILTTHEYGAPTMYLWWSQGLPESYGNPPVPAYPDRGPLAGRYRFLYRDILIPRGLALPLVISEAGIDGGAGAGQRPGYSNAQGWMGFRDYWSAELGRSDSVDFYVEQLAWYDSLLRQDSYVIGATIFNVAGGSSPTWASFEASGLIPKLTEYARSLR